MGLPQPLDRPEFAPALASAWREKDLEEGDREFAVPGTAIRHSWAAKCTRAIAYHVSGQEPSDELDLPAYWTFGIGRLLHEHYQQALTDLYEPMGYTVEHEVKLLTNFNSSGHADTHITNTDGYKVSIEIKTINGYGYKFAVGAAKGPARGPRWSAVVQGSVNAYTADADELRIVYLPLESISKQAAERAGIPEHLRCAAEWVLTKEEFTAIAKSELERWNYITDTVEAGELPPRILVDPELPSDATVTNPAQSSWFSASEGRFGKTWQCEYCEFQEVCASDDR